jgi:hypothetical protein
MGNFIDLTGMSFGKITVIELDHKRQERISGMDKDGL